MRVLINLAQSIVVARSNGGMYNGVTAMVGSVVTESTEFMIFKPIRLIRNEVEGLGSHSIVIGDLQPITLQRGAIISVQPWGSEASPKLEEES